MNFKIIYVLIVLSVFTLNTNFVHCEDNKTNLTQSKDEINNLSDVNNELVDNVDNDDDENDDSFEELKREKKSASGPLTTVCVEIKPANPQDEPYFMCRGAKSASIPAGIYQKNSLPSMGYQQGNLQQFNYGDIQKSVAPVASIAPLTSYGLNSNNAYKPVGSFGLPSLSGGALSSYSYQQQPIRPSYSLGQFPSYGLRTDSIKQINNPVPVQSLQYGNEQNLVPSVLNQGPTLYGRVVPTPEEINSRKTSQNEMYQVAPAPNSELTDSTGNKGNQDRTFHKLLFKKGGFHGGSYSSEESGEYNSYGHGNHGYNNGGYYNHGYGNYGGHGYNHGYNHGYSHGGYGNYGYGNKGGYYSYGRAEDNPTNKPLEKTTQDDNNGSTLREFTPLEDGTWTQQPQPVPQSNQRSYSPASAYSAPLKYLPSVQYSYPSPAPKVRCGSNLLVSCQPQVVPVPCSASPASLSYAPSLPAAVRPISSYVPVSRPVQPNYALSSPSLYRIQNPLQPIVYYELNQPQQSNSQAKSNDDSSGTSIQRSSDESSRKNTENDHVLHTMNGGHDDSHWKFDNSKHTQNDNGSKPQNIDMKKDDGTRKETNPNQHQKQNDLKHKNENVQTTRVDDTMMKMAQMGQMLQSAKM